ncbi:MAG: lysozyme [Burkholderiaceae bacterium]
MSISERGLDLIKEFEGLRLEAYLCPADVWTIGFGTTEGVTLGMRITEEEAERLLRRDVAKYEKAVNDLLQGAATTQEQFDCCVVFSYNVGINAFKKSTFLRRHLSGDYAGAAEALQWFNKANGKVLNGLVRRRKAEAALYLS